MIVLGRAPVALELLDRRSAIYSSRPRMIMTSEVSPLNLSFFSRNPALPVHFALPTARQPRFANDLHAGSFGGFFCVLRLFMEFTS